MTAPRPLATLAVRPGAHALTCTAEDSQAELRAWGFDVLDVAAARSMAAARRSLAAVLRAGGRPTLTHVCLAGGAAALREARRLAREKGVSRCENE